jgi:iron complex outermembrane receptor protein
MKKYFLRNIKFLFVFTIGFQIYAQNVNGVVLGEEGPLPGATVLVKGSNIGTTTDFDGNFSIEASQNDILVISFIGFSTQEVTIGNQTDLTISLLPNTELDEVILVGYGTQKKEELTSAITKIESKDFNGGNINDPTQLLQGKIAGLNIARVGGDPNKPFNIRLRGLSTFGANAEPLVVIDGVIGGSLDSVDPSDIESINVLKDASAAAIYGTRGSSGVILITTKSGKGISQSGFEYRVYASSEEISNIIPMASTSQFLSNGGLDLGSDNNWVDLVSRNATSVVHNLAFTGSGDNGLTYRASLNYRDIEGILNTSAYEQINGRISVSQSFLNDKVRFQGNLGITSREASLGFTDALNIALIFNPTAPIYNEDGSFFQNKVQDSYNPVAINEKSKNDQEKNTFLANFKLDFDLTDDLTLSASYSTQYKNSFRGIYYDNDAFWRGLGDNGFAQRIHDEEKFSLSELTATYRGELNDFSYELLAGYAYQEFTYQGTNVINRDFLTNEVSYNNLALGLGINDNKGYMGSYKEEAKLASAFARLNLNYQNFLYFSASFRNEDSSRFGPNYRTGSFWATSAGIDINKLFDIQGVDQLKLRAGYGVTGNEPSERYAYIQKLGALGQGFINSEFKTSIGPQSNPNPDLKWEEKGELNVGIDFIALDSKLSGSLDYFNRTTTDLLRDTPVSSPPNIYTSTLLNLGELETTGFEVAFDYSAISKDDFSWNVGFNLSNFEVKLINISDQDEFVTYSGNLGAPGLNYTYPIVLEEGSVLGNIRAGVFAGYDDQGRTLIINQETGEPTLERNLDRDGVIVGNGLPEYSFGISNNFTYQNWDLNILLRGVTGHSLVNIPRAYWEHPGLSGRQNFAYTKYFNPDDSELDAYHSGMVEKADFLRLDNATLGYTFSLPEDSKIDNLRVYFSGNNLFTITDYTGSDPEVRYDDFGDILVPGIDRRTSEYFPTKTYTIGLNINF